MMRVPFFVCFAIIYCNFAFLGLLKHQLTTCGDLPEKKDEKRKRWKAKKSLWSMRSHWPFPFWHFLENENKQNKTKFSKEMKKTRPDVTLRHVWHARSIEWPSQALRLHFKSILYVLPAASCICWAYVHVRVCVRLSALHFFFIVVAVVVSWFCESELFGRCCCYCFPLPLPPAKMCMTLLECFVY